MVRLTSRVMAWWLLGLGAEVILACVRATSWEADGWAVSC